MKNQGFYVLLTITFLLIGFAAGIYVGRNFNTGPVQLSTFTTQALETTQPAPQATPPVSSGSNPTAPTGTVPTEGSNPTVPTVEPSATQPPTVGDGRININTADIGQLQMLPGIGEVLAQRIIDYRVTIGHFQSVEELLNVDGIGVKRFEAIVDLITT